MKSLILLLLSVLMSFTIMLHGQENSIEDVPKSIIQCLDKVGKDSSIVLNVCESTYLDYYFQRQRGSFLFENKCVFFLTGNYGAIKSNKKIYYAEAKQVLSTGVLPSIGMQQLVIFDGHERKSIGYDAAIISGSKKYLTKKDVIKHIKKRQ